MDSWQQNERVVDSIATEQNGDGFHSNRMKDWQIPLQQREGLVDSITTERKTGGFQTNPEK